MSFSRFFGRKKNKQPSQSDQIHTTREPQCESPTIDYTDPTIYRRVVDDNPHLHKNIVQNPVGDSFKFRGNWSTSIRCYKRCCWSPQVKFLIDFAGWNHFFRIDTGKSSKRLVEALIERWWDTTHTFHLPFGEMGFTPLDWIMLTGIPIGQGEHPPYNDEKYNFEVVKACIFPEITTSDWKSMSIRCSFLKNYFEPNMLAAAEEDATVAERIARAFFMLFIGEFLFPNAAALVGSGWLAALEDIKKIGTYDWGTPAVALMYLSLDACSRQQIKTFNGPWQVLEYWAYEYMNICVPKSAMKTNFADTIAATDIRPRIARWNLDQLDERRQDQIRFNISMARNQLEMRTTRSIIWQPYMDSSYLQNSDVEIASELSSHRIILQYCMQGVWYLGDRCYRQMTGFITIPRDPPTPMSRMSQADYCPPIDASTLVQPVSQGIYDQYWARVSVGAIMPSLSHAGNVDFIGAASLSDPAFKLPHAPPPFYAPMEYITQPDLTVPSRQGERIVEVPLSGGQTITMPLGQGLIPIDTHEVLSNHEWQIRYQESTSREALLRQFIISSTVLRDNIAHQSQGGPPEQCPGQSFHQLDSRPWEQWPEQSSQQPPRHSLQQWPEQSSQQWQGQSSQQWPEQSSQQWQGQSSQQWAGQSSQQSPRHSLQQWPGQSSNRWF